VDDQCTGWTVCKGAHTQAVVRVLRLSRHIPAVLIGPSSV
jgi:hypothetical protein